MRGKIKGARVLFSPASFVFGKSTEVDEVNEIASKTNGKIVSGIQTIKSISLSINHGVNFLWEYIFPS